MGRAIYLWLSCHPYSAHIGNHILSPDVSIKMLDIFHSKLRNKFPWNRKRNSCIFIQRNALENIVCEMATCLSRPLSEPIMLSLLTHICVTRFEWFYKPTGSMCYHLTRAKHKVRNKMGAVLEATYWYVYTGLYTFAFQFHLNVFQKVWIENHSEMSQWLLTEQTTKPHLY